MLHSDCPPPVWQLVFIDDRGLGVDSVPMKNRKNVPDVGIFQRVDATAAYIALADPDNKTDNQGTLHQPPSMLQARCKMPIDVQRMLVQAEKAEKGIVEFGDGAAGPVSKRLARF